MGLKLKLLAATCTWVLFTGTLAGCHTFEVRQFDSVKHNQQVQFTSAAVIMNSLAGNKTEDRNKLFSEQLIVSLQKRGIDVAERQKVESLLVDAEMVTEGLANLTETERAKRLGKLLKADVIIYADAFVNYSQYRYFARPIFNNETKRWQLEKEANENGIVRRQGFPVLANHAIGLSMRGVDSATGEIVWVGYRFKASAKWVDDERPETLTNFDVVRGVCDEISDDLLTIRKS